jgi:hypothetical protein
MDTTLDLLNAVSVSPLKIRDVLRKSDVEMSRLSKSTFYGRLSIMMDLRDINYVLYAEIT